METALAPSTRRGSATFAENPKLERRIDRLYSILGEDGLNLAFFLYVVVKIFGLIT